MLKGRSAGIARVLSGTGPDHAGMGIVVGLRHVLTCAHVVNVAMGRSIDAASEPHQKAVIHLDFPFVAGVRARAHWLRWRAPDSNAGDLALLELAEDIPREVGFAVLADVRGVPVINDRLSVFGYPASHPSGKHVEGEFKGDVGRRWAQIVGSKNEGVFIEGGYSGSGIWDDTQDAFIGMLVARESGPTERVAYAIPVASLREFVPELDIETRRVFRSFHGTWATLATITLILLFLHFLRTTIGQAGGLDTVMFWAPDSQLAELWGMHFFMVLTPFLFFLLLRHARSFRLHDWWERLPSFRGRGPSAGVHNTPAAAAVTLLLFSVVPLYIQGHFINQFHDEEGAVAIYPDRFGMTVDELRESGSCSVESVPVCTHPKAGLYSLVEPIRGVRNYWENAYHYGNASDLSRTQTFFPIWQPVVIYVLSAVSLLLATLSAVAIARPRPLSLKLNTQHWSRQA